ncbi:MAG: cytochrome c biogenesis protein CcsA [Fibrobacter sp.]|nr:cytochrome c biogenesis protein CcsA [Fibrobacter sp.]
MAFRMPKVRGVCGGWRNLGLYGMHAALLILLVGSLVGSEFRQEYNGFRAVPPTKPVTYYAVSDSMNMNEVAITEGYPYFVFYKGQVDMFGVTVDVFTATYDPFKFVPYVFMVLFLFSVVFHYVARVRINVSKPAKNGGLPTTTEMKVNEKKSKSKILPALFFAMFGVMFAPPSQANQDMVQVGDAYRLYDSFARGVLDDFSGRVTYKCLPTDDCNGKISAETVVRKIADKSADGYRLFKVLRGDVQHALGVPESERYVSYDQLNKFRNELEIYASRKDDLAATAEMQRLLGNVQLYEAIRQGSFMPHIEMSDDGKISAELFYNKINFALVAFILAFLGCALAVVNSIFKKGLLDVGANLACGMASLVLASAFAMRIYITGNPPLSSLYEIVLLVSLLLETFEFGAFIFCKKRTFSLIIPLTLMASVLLFFAKFILEPGDLFQPIPAVLNSSAFLTIHVFTIALGFAGMILSGVVAHVTLWRECGDAVRTHFGELNNIRRLLYGTLVFGSAFTIVGTLLGGVWADFAWGRFWGFDPKECGALFVCLWGMLLLHLRGGHLIGEKTFALLNCFNVVITFLCWFGINLLGIGLHSYGFQGGTVMWLGGFVILDLAIIALIAKFCPSRHF